MLAHGGVPGAIAEVLTAVAIVAVAVVIWIRERRGGSAD
jgi:hypothetical protein